MDFSSFLRKKIKKRKSFGILPSLADDRRAKRKLARENLQRDKDGIQACPPRDGRDFCHPPSLATGCLLIAFWKKKNPFSVKSCTEIIPRLKNEMLSGSAVLLKLRENTDRAFRLYYFTYYIHTHYTLEALDIYLLYVQGSQQYKWQTAKV